MSTVSVSEARANLQKVVVSAQTEAVFIEERGRPAAVVISPERYEELMDALEESEDIGAFDAATTEEGDNIPLDQVKTDLGWT